jgi:hypothetical protein
VSTKQKRGRIELPGGYYIAKPQEIFRAGLSAALTGARLVMRLAVIIPRAVGLLLE